MARITWTPHPAPAETQGRYTVRWVSDTEPHGIIYLKGDHYEAWEPYDWGMSDWDWGCRGDRFKTLEQAQRFLEPILRALGADKGRKSPRDPKPQ